MRWNDLSEEQRYAYWSRVISSYEDAELWRMLPYPFYCDDLMKDNPMIHKWAIL